MKSKILAEVLRGCLLTVLILTPAPQHTAAAQAAEQVETGHLATPDGRQLAYRIRLLPLASYPAIPDAIRAQLEARRCMVPQTYEAHEPENVVHGAFERPGSSDWAVLCSADGSTSLLVFFADRPAAPFTLAGGKDPQWIAVAPGGPVRGFAWGIDSIGPAEIALELQSVPDAFDHDAVRDEFIGEVSTIHYFKNGGWTSASPSD